MIGNHCYGSGSKLECSRVLLQFLGFGLGFCKLVRLAPFFVLLVFVCGLVSCTYLF